MSMGADPGRLVGCPLLPPGAVRVGGFLGFEVITSGTDLSDSSPASTSYSSCKLVPGACGFVTGTEDMGLWDEGGEVRGHGVGRCRIERSFPSELQGGNREARTIGLAGTGRRGDQVVDREAIEFTIEDGVLDDLGRFVGGNDPPRVGAPVVWLLRRLLHTTDVGFRGREGLVVRAGGRAGTSQSAEGLA